MTRAFTLADSLALGDLARLPRARCRVEDGSVRLIGGSGVLAVYVGGAAPRGPARREPDGARAAHLRARPTRPRPFDVVVPVRSLLSASRRLQNERRRPDRRGHRLAAHGGQHGHLGRHLAAARRLARARPRSSADRSSRRAEAGIDEVAAAIPTGTGEQIVHRVRSEVWWTARSRASSTCRPAPAFAALSLGFLGEDDGRVFETGTWTPAHDGGPRARRSDGGLGLSLQGRQPGAGPRVSAACVSRRTC